MATFDDPPSAERLQDFDRVFLLSPSSEAQAELEIGFIDALVAAGHRPHVVKVAADGFVDPGCDVRFMRSHREIARHLDASGLPASYLAPSPYMEMLLPSARGHPPGGHAVRPGRPRQGGVRGRRGRGRRRRAAADRPGHLRPAAILLCSR